ncbi:cell division protein ZapE [Arenimonas fontis]|uniref:AFG1 family ATPase n=1 Tax=Arenimonas fontis TaxID=2608255 RepID=A0A5B2ZAB4_9GAMM|nr:cell division protein ZapE [Arenimonas fontis]KAA2284101.1 AFG1 family ATPase [Arenimonas fontis]
MTENPVLLPSAAYAAGVAAGRWRPDPAQQPALAELDRIHRGLLAGQARRGWRRWFGPPPAPVPGLYLWGGVGRGKTFLTELLVEHLGGLPRRRWHFHRFMVEMHARIQALPDDTADTVAVVADGLAEELRLLVLDEFVVNDIADAMILGRLLERLFARGVVLVTTSNIEPAGLYRDGLQRQRFLPAIALLERHCAVLELDGAEDYRLRQLTRAETYLTPLGPAAEQALAEHYRRLAADCARETGPLVVNGRAIPVRALAEGIAWFDFPALCEGPRSAADFVEIARDFHTVLLSGVPLMDARSDNAARRFVHLVDELYDRNVNLLLSAAADPLWLYGGDKLRQEFERTASRLVEMRSAEYLARGHRP